MSVDLLESGAEALGEIRRDVVFVGGATMTLWITDPAAPPPRPTKDVDVIVEVATRNAYYRFEDRMRAHGFRDEGNVLCRWIHERNGLILDAMPTDAELLGFENRWQREAFPHAVERELPSGASIGAVPPAFLLATKIEAFRGRGEGDYLGSRDFADIVALRLPMLHWPLVTFSTTMRSPSSDSDMSTPAVYAPPLLVPALSQ